MSIEDPIQNLGNIDIVGERNDGSVDLIIVASSKLLDNTHHDDLLTQKIQAYTNAIFSDGWQNEYGKGAVTIYIRATELPDQGIINTIAAIKKYLVDFNVDLFLQVEE